VRAERDALVTAIALRLHHRRAGSWPGSLTELTPHLLPEVPRDPFTGDGMKYLVREGRPVLYSVGTDRDDDGGVLPAARPRKTLTDVLRRVSEWHPPQRRAEWREAGRLPDGDWVLWPPPSVPDQEP
jgi:hypothetical protein